MNIFKRVIRIITYVLLSFCLIGLIFCAVSSDKLDFIEYKLKSDKVNNEFTCLVISDYHHRSLNFENGNMITKLKEQGPVDTIFFVGDLIDSHTKSLDDVQEIFNATKEISKQSYFVTGNHEQYAPRWEELKDLMHDNNVTYLNDARAVFNDIDIYGLDDPRFKFGGESTFKNREEMNKKTLYKLTEHFDESKFNILLVHRPENFKMIADNFKFDMVVSGHTHGGQFRIGNWVPSSIALEESDYMGGEYHRNNTSLYVSRGLGYSAMFPIRVNCNPEIIKITISK